MRIIKSFLFGGVAFILTLFVCELFIRTAHIANVSSTEVYEEIGRGRRKNLRYVYFNEGFGIGQYNKFGYIGEPHPFEKPANTIRVALMGDSYVESLQVFERDYFGNIAESILKDQYPQTQIELLNFGRGNSDIGDLYVLHTNFASRFNPDYVVYMLAEADLTPRYLDPVRPKTILDGDSLVIFQDFANSELETYQKTKFLIHNSAFLNMLNTCRKKSKTVPIAATLLDKVYTWIYPSYEAPGEDSAQSPLLALNPVTDSILASLNPSQVVFVNRTDQPLPQVFVDKCTAQGFYYHDLSMPLNQMKESGIHPVKWKISGQTGHWNHAAHKVVGRDMAKVIGSLLEKNKRISLYSNSRGN
ncbi:MAG: hypothetical protein AAF694_20130 [Bacteroidota bacterium]